MKSRVNKKAENVLQNFHTPYKLTNYVWIHYHKSCDVIHMPRMWKYFENSRRSSANANRARKLSIHRSEKRLQLNKRSSVICGTHIVINQWIEVEGMGFVSDHRKTSINFNSETDSSQQHSNACTAGMSTDGKWENFNNNERRARSYRKHDIYKNGLEGKETDSEPGLARGSREIS